MDLGRIAEWCPGCFAGWKPVPVVTGLDTYLALLARAYMVPLRGMAANLADPRTREMIEGSTYLDTLLRDAAAVHNDLGVNLVLEGRLEEAIEQFEEALGLQSDLASARRNLTAAQDVLGRSSGGPEVR